MCCHIGRCRYIICIGSCRTNWLYIPGSIQTGDFQMPITLSKIYSFCYVFWSPWSDASFALLNFQDLLKNIFSLWKKLDPYSTHVCVHTPWRQYEARNQPRFVQVRVCVWENTSIKNTGPMTKSKNACRTWSLVARLQKQELKTLLSIPLHYIFMRTKDKLIKIYPRFGTFIWRCL